MNARLLAGLLCALVVVPGAPHLVALSHPHEVAEATSAWLQRVDG